MDYEELMDSGDDDPGGSDVTKQTQCETCFRYFSSQLQLESHRSAPHRCQVCCKKFSSRVRLSEYRFICIFEIPQYLPLMFAQACVKNSVQGDLPGTHPPYADTPPRADTPLWADTPPPLSRRPPSRHPSPPEMATIADGTHPTGMHCCKLGLSCRTVKTRRVLGVYLLLAWAPLLRSFRGVVQVVLVAGDCTAWFTRNVFAPFFSPF